jgi:hypothetical protein
MMKRYLIALVVSPFLFTSCDKVENPYPPQVPQGTWELYPNGDSADYYNNVFQPFTANTNTNRNLLIEDFTGHKCVFCPAAADEAHNIELANPGRVFTAGVHASPLGMGSFQVVDPPTYEHDFTCPEGLSIGQYFGNDWPGSPFQGNPYGAVSRADGGNGFPVQSPSSWNSTATSLISTNDLKVNIQAQSNYYPSTRGLFLHTEIENLQGVSNELRTVVYLIEDSIQKPQLFPAPTNDSLEYVHHDVLRGCIDGKTFGAELDVAHLDQNGKYYFNYIFELPAQYDPSNMHLLIYVRDAVTEEIYHVIRESIQ